MRRLLSVVAFVGLVVPSAFADPGDQNEEKGKDRPSDAGKPDDGKGGAKSGQEGRLAEIDKKIQGEIDKHADRVAKIDRLAELLDSKKDEKSKADLTHMREQEDARHKNAMRVLSDHRARIVEGKDTGEKAKEKGKGKDKDDDKSKGKSEGKGDEGKGDAKGKDKEKEHEKGKDKDDGKEKDKDKDKKDDKGDGDDKKGSGNGKGGK